MIHTSEANKAAIYTIDAAAFLVCLDDATPTTPKERCAQFLFSNPFNRYYDKTLQFVVCANGVSASLIEHSQLDGIAVEPLHAALNTAILAHISLPTPSMPPTSVLNLEKLPITIPVSIQTQITKIERSLSASMSSYTFSSLSTTALSSTFFRTHRCPPQSGLQLAIQLSLRRFFGTTLPAQETVSLAHFRQGRVEVHHVINAAVARFLEAAIDTFAHSPIQSSWDNGSIASSTSAVSIQDLKQLFYTAATAHTKSLSRCSQGQGFSRHLTALEWAFEDLRAKDPLFQEPELFRNEVYKRLKPGKIMVSGFTTGWEEGGVVYPVPGGVLIYFEMFGAGGTDGTGERGANSPGVAADEKGKRKEGGVKFSIFGNGIDAEGVKRELERGISEIRALLEVVTEGG